MWQSTNAGLLWTQISVGYIGIRWGHTAVALGSSTIVVMGGRKSSFTKPLGNGQYAMETVISNDILISNDGGVTWNLQLPLQSPWGPREFHSVIMYSYLNRMLLIGGKMADNVSLDNDIWFSNNTSSTILPVTKVNLPASDFNTALSNSAIALTKINNYNYILMVGGFVVKANIATNSIWYSLVSSCPLPAYIGEGEHCKCNEGFFGASVYDSANNAWTGCSSCQSQYWSSIGNNDNSCFPIPCSSTGYTGIR